MRHATCDILRNTLYPESGLKGDVVLDRAVYGLETGALGGAIEVACDAVLQRRLTSKTQCPMHRTF